MEAQCAECDAKIPIPSDALVGEILRCKECGAEYEISELGEGGSVKLKSAELAEEDWGE
jgi:lysine biosynthesis protein LysW